MPAQIYIALYGAKDSNDEYHWAIISTEKGSLKGKVQLHEIKWMSNKWVAWHHNLVVTNSFTFFGCVALPANSSLTSKTVDSFFDTAGEEPAQGSTPNLKTHTKWSCAQWIIHGLRALEIAQNVDLQLGLKEELGKEKFYQRICKLGTAIHENKLEGERKVDDIRVADF